MYASVLSSPPQGIDSPTRAWDRCEDPAHDPLGRVFFFFFFLLGTISFNRPLSEIRVKLQLFSPHNYPSTAARRNLSWVFITTFLSPPDASLTRFGAALYLRTGPHHPVLAERNPMLPCLLSGKPCCGYLESPHLMSSCLSDVSSLQSPSVTVIQLPHRKRRNSCTYAMYHAMPCHVMMSQLFCFFCFFSFFPLFLRRHLSLVLHPVKRLARVDGSTKTPSWPVWNPP